MTGLTKKRIRLIALVLVGLCILLYPTVSDRWNAYRQRQLVSGYNEVVSTQTDDTLERIRSEAIVYNARLVGSSVPDIFIRMESIDDKEYDNLLDPGGNGVMGVVEIPCISVNLPVYHSTSDSVLEKGAGHLPGSSLPVGGEGTHAVLSAHRGLPSARMFTDLDRVREGDEFYIHVLGEILAYEVDKVQVVEPDETESLAIDSKEDYVTLVTCTPYGVNTQRLLVRGHRVDYVAAERDRQAAHKAPPSRYSVVMRALCVLAGLLLGWAAVILPQLIRRRFRR